MIFLLFLCVLCPIIAFESNEDGVTTSQQFLHKTPSVVLEKLFTVGPHEKEINLDFNVDNSEEDPHNEVRRSAPEVRLTEMGDKTIPLEELEQTTTPSSGNETESRFDLPIYDFMIPAGQQDNSSLLAMITYKTKSDQKPTFKVVMDRLNWFKMGDSKSNKVSDVTEYEIPILLVAGADVRPELTKNSVYKFGIEAVEDGNVASSRVRVEVFSFSPTTKRVKTTTTPEVTEAIRIEETSTTTMTTTTTLPTTKSETKTPATKEESIVATKEATTTSKSIEITTSESTTMATSSEAASSAGSTSESTSSMNPEMLSSTEEPTKTHKSVEGPLDEGIFAVAVDTTTVSSTMITTDDLLLSDQVTTDEPMSTTTEVIKSKATEDPVVITTEATHDSVPTTTKAFAEEVMITTEEVTTPKSETPSTETTTMKSSSRSEVPSPAKTVEGSGFREDDSEEEDNPLTEVVTVATPIVQSGEPVKPTVSIFGLVDNVFVIPDPLGRGDLLRGLVISADRVMKSKKLMSVSVDRPELFSVRPGLIESGGKAYLFANHPGFTGDVKVKVTVTDGQASEEKTITIKNAVSKDSNAVRRESFSVPEDAPSGTVIGKVQDGMKIAGKPGLFALVGSDIILSCLSEVPCLDYEAQRAHYLLLTSRTDPTKASEVVIQVGDINDNSPTIETTDAVIRIADGELIMPFAVQIVDADSPAVQENVLSVKGSASDFISLEKIDADLYQVKVRGPSSPGRYELVIDVNDGAHKVHKKSIRVLVQNSHSHAHFRRGRYERSITPERLRPGAEVSRVELEGIPIDEARFVILKGNPGWLSIDDYGGTVTFTRPSRTPASGTYEATVAALGRETGRILAQTVVSVTLMGAPEAKKVFQKSIYEKTMDRESSSEISITLETLPGAAVELDRSSLFAIDENGQSVAFSLEDVSITGNTVTLSKTAISDLRVVRMELVAGEEKSTVVMHLTSSAEFLDHRRRMNNRPQFPIHPTVIEIDEELPVGHIIATIPAVHPETGDLVETSLEGGDGAFELDYKTGSLKIAKRLDYDDPQTPSEINLIITAGETGYESTINLKIRVLDIDDNSPVIHKDSLASKIVVPENIPVDTVISRVTVSDKDEISLRNGLTVGLMGPTNDFFRASIANKTVTVQVAKALDREEFEQHPLLLTVVDQAGHMDSVPLTVSLSDINDNSPHFLKEIYNLQAVENWPAGLILETLRAVDEDSKERGHVTYSLESMNSKYFSLDQVTGELKISRDLMGLAREEPYLLTAVATDGGSPPRNTTVPVRITVSEPRRPNKPVLNFLTPPPGYILQLKGDLKPNEKVYQAKAKIDGDARNVKYSVQELMSSEMSPFGIDESSEELFVSKAPSKETNHILLLTAKHLHSGANATRLVRAHFTPTSRSTPVFPEGSSLYFPFKRNGLIGRVQATVEDEGAIFYYLIPSCSPATALFSLNSTSGDFFHSGPESPKGNRVELCVHASAVPLTETAGLTLNPQSKDSINVIVANERDQQSLPDISSINNTVTTIDRHLSFMAVDLSEEELKPSYNFSVLEVSFTPAETILPLTTAAPLPSLFTVDNRGLIRTSPSISSQPSGIYNVKLEATPKTGATEQLIQEVHLVPPTARLRFVFDRQLIPVAKDIQTFQRELIATLEKNEEDVHLRLIIDNPKLYVYNTSRSSVCFHAVSPHNILSPQSTLKALGKVSDLFQVYNNFSVVDIESTCEEPKSVEIPMAAALASPTALLLFSLIALAILLFFMIFVYFCFVRRYRDYLRAKEKAMKGPPQPVPATPTFVLTPPSTASPPMAPLGYWEG